LEILQSRVDPDWRSDEWHQEDWLFVSNPDNPRTRMFRCSTSGCPYLTTSPNNLPCKTCALLREQASGDETEFARLFAMQRFTPRIQYGKPKEQCRVERDSERCQRAAWAQGVCDAHYSQWRNTYMAKGMSLDDLLATGKPRPLPPLGPCIVRACQRDRGTGQTGLCLTHKEGYRSRVAFLGRQGQSVTIEDYAATAGPIKARGNFCLLGLNETVRWELLYALQMDDTADIRLDPIIVSHAVGRLEGETSVLSPGFVERALDGIQKHTSLPSWLRRVVKNLKLLEADTSGIDHTAGDVWDSMLVRLTTSAHKSGKANPASRERYSEKRLPIDFRPIRQEWLRELVKQWARDVQPTTTKLHSTIDAFTYMSKALSTRPGGDDPATAGIRDITRTVALITEATGEDGELLSATTRSSRLSDVRQCLAYLRPAGLMSHVPDGFMVTREHRIKRNENAEPSGRALPDRAMAIIIAELDKVAPKKAQTGSLLSVEVLTRMHMAAMRTLIDTGRRPKEVCALRVGCVTGQNKGGTIEYTLTYDNTKAGRDGRTLPITTDTARVLLDWEQERKALGLPKKYDKWLFPTPSVGRADAHKHLTVAAMGNALERLLAALPSLDSDMPDRDRNAYLPYAGEVTLYSFRHSYAQRHADAGVPVDTLKDLMDHRSIKTTMGYYQVSAGRKREAIKAISGFTVNRHGESAPMGSATAYEVGTVAVPFGNCADPSNVKAGGQRCPIRFRCSGCDMYRPDPSYLPALEQHLIDLRADLAIVEAAGTAADWVTFEMRQEIDSFSAIVQSIRQRVDSLDGDKREALDDASVALRRLRGHRPLLPVAGITTGAS
jgi:integrase